MKNTSDKSKAEITREIGTKKISRKELLKKSGYLAATTMIILLGTGKAQAETSPQPPPPWG